jgi:hypothetical protein
VRGGLRARGAALDRALADFAELDADQNELDDAALIGAVETGWRQGAARARGAHWRLAAGHPIRMTIIRSASLIMVHV